jgi:hypothetical protein
MRVLDAYAWRVTLSLLRTQKRLRLSGAECRAARQTDRQREREKKKMDIKEIKPDPTASSFSPPPSHIQQKQKQ